MNPTDPTATAFSVLHAVARPISTRAHDDNLIAMTTYGPDQWDLRMHVTPVDHPDVKITDSEHGPIAVVYVEAETLLAAVEKMTLIARSIATVTASERVA